MSYSAYHKLRVLVVDDFDSFRQTVSNMLESFGVHSIDNATSGAETIRWCSEKQFDLILCDYNLGRGKTGQQILEEMRFRKILSRETLFILISAESSRAIVMSAYDYEPDAYLAKPITGKSLKQRLDRLLAQRDELVPIYKALDDNREDDAAEMLQRKIVSGSRISTQCQKMLGELYLQTQQFELAEQVYRQALEIRTLDWAKVGMARVKQAMNQHGDAKMWLEEIIKTNPLCMTAYDALANVWAQENDKEELTRVLKQAVEQSPMAILRQERLAYAAREINDNVTAANAFRHAVRLGAHSCHNKLENHINFGRTTAALLKEDQSVATDLSREAIKDLEELSSQFTLTDEQQVQALLVESNVLIGQGNKRKAQEILQRAEKSMAKLSVVEDVDTELDYVLALNANGQTDKGGMLLQNLVDRYRNNQKALEKIDRLLEEPVSENNRDLVADMNRDGIGHYDNREYREAVRCFETAKKIFPNHLGIQLNLVQALEGELSEYGFDSETLLKAQRNIAFVKKRITGEHAQYDRYLQLQDMIAAHKKQ